MKVSVQANKKCMIIKKWVCLICCFAICCKIYSQDVINMRVNEDVRNIGINEKFSGIIKYFYTKYKNDTNHILDDSNYFLENKISYYLDKKEKYNVLYIRRKNEFGGNEYGRMFFQEIYQEGELIGYNIIYEGFFKNGQRVEYFKPNFISIDGDIILEGCWFEKSRSDGSANKVSIFSKPRFLFNYVSNSEYGTTTYFDNIIKDFLIYDADIKNLPNKVLMSVTNKNSDDLTRSSATDLFIKDIDVIEEGEI